MPKKLDPNCPKLNALKRAIEIAGSQNALARKLGLKNAYVWNWLHLYGQVSPLYAVAVEKVTEGKVTREELRPDVFYD